MKAWRCHDCRHVVVAEEKPEPMKWDDGHVCVFAEKRDYFNADDFVTPPKPKDVIFYKTKGDEL